VAVIAARQYGNVTYRQLLDAGLSRTAVLVRVREGRLFPVHRAVYAVGHPPRLPQERAAAAVPACGNDAALSHLGALALWGFIKTWPDTFDVTVTAGDPRRRGITAHRPSNLLPRDTTVELGIPVTSPARRCWTAPRSSTTPAPSPTPSTPRSSLSGRSPTSAPGSPITKAPSSWIRS
jgi:Transcriptional regulator, AbiEi antitoxin